MFFLLVPITGFSLHYWCLAAPLLESPIKITLLALLRYEKDLRVSDYL